MSSTQFRLRNWGGLTSAVRGSRTSRGVKVIRRDPLGGGNSYLGSNKKRIVDVAAAVVLLLLLLPLIIIIAVAIRTTSTGPVLFRQRRHGVGMRPFYILKFRSMSVMECGSTVTQAQRNDPRITPVGRVLRRTSLDELPQIINVLRGEMSLVGPRPHATVHDEHYSSCVYGYTERFAVRPGLTGLAQVSGARGATPRQSDMQRRIDYDLQYIGRASLLLDLGILVRTIREIAVSAEAF